MKKIHLSKMAKIFLLLGSLSVATATTAVVTILFFNSNKQVKIKYLFANQEFDNKEQVFDYAYSQAKNTNYNFENTKFLIDDKVFNSKNELNEFIQKTYPIESLSTIKNPSDSRYLVSSSGELNQLVLTGKSEKGIDVYKGINGDAFTQPDAALNTYLNSYEQKYSVDGIYFDSFYNAQKYYTEIIQEKLNDPKSEPVKKVYTHGGVEYREGTEKEIKSWIKSTLKRGFEYNGKIFSDYNYSEFKEAMKNLDKNIIDANILPVVDGDKSSYWIDQKTTNQAGYFIGPKYIESNEQVGRTAHFEVIDTQDVNAIIEIATGGKITFAIASDAIENVTKGVVSTFKFETYLDEIFAKFNLNKNILKNFKENYLIRFGQAIMADVSASLNEIDDEECTNFHKMLIVFKRLLTAAKVYDVTGASGSDYEGFEQSIKEIVVQILSLQNKFMVKMFTPESLPDSKEWTGFLLNEKVPFDDIYSLFLNAQKFYNDGGMQGALGGAIKKASGITQDIIGKILELGGHISTIATGIEDLQKTPEKSVENYKEGSKKVFSEVNSGLNAVSTETIAEEFGLELKEDKTQILPLLAAIGIAAAVWAIGEMASFTTFITAEAKIDSKTSIYYFEPTFKIPFTKILPSVTNVDTEITPLVKAPVEMMLPPGEDGKDVPVYEFNHQYYLDLEIAKKKLIEAIYLNPELYLSCKRLVASGYGDPYFLDLPPICKDDCPLFHIHMTASRQQEIVAQEKDKFVEKLFNRYYEPEAKLYYNDGFHEFFEEKKDALNSLQKKVLDVKNYQEAYSYTINGQVFYKDTKAEIIQFIKDNQLIENKRVINTDLIEGMFFDNIPNYYDKEYKIYKVVISGNQYFRTKLEAEKYLENKLNIETLNYYETINTYHYNDSNFMNKREFEDWIESRIKEV